MAEIDLMYINLDRATERRESLEQNIRDANFSSAWRMHRFPAVQATSDQVAKMPGAASANLKGNWLSHIGCMWHAISNGWQSHLLIVEDDAKFSNKAESVINLAVNHLSPDSWDIIFLDLIIGRAIDMPYFFSLRQNCAMNDNNSVIVNMNWLHDHFALTGAGAYLVNKASLVNIFRQFNADEISVAYDVILRHMITTNAVKAFAVFPFPVTVSAHSDSPTVDHTDAWVYECSLMNEFRRLIWTESELELQKRAIARGEVTPDVLKFQSIFSRLLSIQHGVT
ncbi:glycosyltransferase family 25 protein [Niveispirillum cyanobacteriorum]|uniref:Glycosyl transferase family 25 domain-containing protein n=1 Tax=Niveispirillum cyanobacteriorum TaxID=1612173 RepID=A0A2K9N773_9PROT|nr:glycosyltransferase family 25 protein [Niveispirillum cyanobacteriorum]AUN28970.1 hypothetical protein C0V82_00915 [Niveispirillum cyanobacteriorum]GGE68660.1 hypothetical protein GCM10011317_27460 [Niveispirillum cyanobacteriorum]